MLLRASSKPAGLKVKLSGVATGEGGSVGIAAARELMAFAEAVMGSNEASLRETRQKLILQVGREATVDAAAVIAAFCANVRVAEATGLPVEKRGSLLRRLVGWRLGVQRPD